MWKNPQFPADLITFNEEIFIGKLRFLCSDKHVLGRIGIRLVGGVFLVYLKAVGYIFLDL